MEIELTLVAGQLAHSAHSDRDSRMFCLGILHDLGCSWRQRDLCRWDPAPSSSRLRTVAIPLDAFAVTYSEVLGVPTSSERLRIEALLTLPSARNTRFVPAVI